MRRFVLSIYMALILFIALPVYAADIEPLKGNAVVTAESLNVRSGPAKDFDKLGTLSKDMTIEIKGIVEPDWYVIEFEGEVGYISSDYVLFVPEDEIEVDNSFSLVSQKYMIMMLVVGILIVSGIAIYTFINIKSNLDEDKEEDEEIPATDYDEINMPMGEVTYDTYRIDIDPKYFEQTSSIPQPESVYDERIEKLWKNDLYGENVEKKIDSENNIQTLDSKLEQASAQIAALQKEVEQLKKQRTES